jgi:hypothetical protein
MMYQHPTGFNLNRKVEKESVEPPYQAFIAAPGSMDVRVWIPEVLPTIQWLV